MIPRRRLVRARRLPARLHRDEAGQGLTEYGLILVLIGIVVILVLVVIGHQVNNSLSNVSNHFP